MLLNAAVLRGSDSDTFTEDLGHVGLTGKATLCSDIDDLDVPPFQEGTSMLDPPLEYISVRRRARRHAEHFKKVPTAVTRLLCE